MRIIDTSDAFDGRYLAVLLDLGDLSCAGANYFAIEDDRAGSADAIAAADLRAGQAETSENVGQRVLRRITNKHQRRRPDVYL